MLWVVIAWILTADAYNCSLEYNPNVVMQLQLSGKHLDIPFDIEPPFSVRNSQGQYSGFSVSVLTRVAQRGNFTFTVIDGAAPLTANETDLDTLQRMIDDETVNMFGSYWTDTAERRAKGAIFSLAYLDTTRVLVTFPDQVLLPSVEEVMFTFLKPFRWDTWLAIVIGCVISGVMTFWFEISPMSGQGKLYKKALQDVKGVRWKTVFPYLVRSFGHFSASGEVLEAQTVAGQLHNIVWAFLVVILLAAYLANLANFLVIRTQQAASFKDINAILAAKATVCVDPTDSVAQFYNRYYPNLKQYPPRDYELYEWAPDGNKPQALVDALRSGFCSGIIMATSIVDVLQKNPDNCDLTKRDDVSAHFGAGFGFPMERCGPFLLAVIDSILVDMQTDGTLNALWVDLVPPNLCPTPSTFFAVASSEALSVDSFAGLFFLYLSFVFVAVILRIARRYCLRAERKLLSRLSRISQKDISMADLSINVNKADTLEEKVMRMDQTMNEILASVLRLNEAKVEKPATTPTEEAGTPHGAASEEVATPRAASSTLS